MEITIDRTGVETNFNMWKLWSTNRNKNLNREYGEAIGFGCYYYDVQTAEYLSKYFKGYIFNPKTFDPPLDETKTRAAHSLDELEQGLIEQSKTQDLYLYMLTYTPSCPVYWVLDEYTFKPKYLDKPELRGGHWKIRYATAEKK